MRQKSTVWLALVTILVTVLAVWVANDSGNREAADGVGEPLFQGLGARLGDVTEIRIGGPDGEVALIRKENTWRVAERADYRSDAVKIRTFLRGAGRAERKERKTGNPEKFDRIGLGEGATEVELLGSGGAVMAAFRVGSSVNRGSGGERWSFVLADGEDTSWLVDQLVVSSSDPANWIDKKISDISDRRFGSVDVTPRSGEHFRLTGGGPIPGEIFVEGLQDGESASAPALARATATALSGLRLEDVALRDDVSGMQLSELVYRMADGLVIKAALSEDSDGRRWLMLDASFDADRAVDPDGPAQFPDAPADGAIEVESLNADWGRWAYQISASDADKFVRLRSDLVTAISDTE